jgi:hypothetical protein
MSVVVDNELQENEGSDALTAFSSAVKSDELVTGVPLLVLVEPPALELVAELFALDASLLPLDEDVLVVVGAVVGAVVFGAVTVAPADAVLLTSNQFWFV